MITPVEPIDEKAIVQLFKLNGDVSGKKVWYRFQHYRRRTEQMAKMTSDSGAVVGFIHWAIQMDGTRSIYDLVVHPEYRRQGFGSLLVAHVGAPATVKISSGYRFFEKLGFKQGPINGGKLVYTLDRAPTEIPKGPWQLTYTGKIINPLDLKPEDICIEDIAHHLSLVNRFAGATAKPISVAQHSVYVSRLCDDTPHRLQALLHDATEAYLGDMVKWLKPSMPAYTKAEERAEQVIFEKFGCPGPIHENVWRADRVMVMFEASKGFGKMWSSSFLQNYPGFEGITEEEQKRIGAWAAWPWRASEEAFLVRFRA